MKKLKPCLLRFMLGVSLAANGASASAEWLSCAGSAMTTRIQAVFWWESERAQGDALCQQALGEFHRIESLMSTYQEDSLLSQVNREAARQAVEVTPELLGLLQRSYRVSELTGGAFDMTFASAGNLYDYRKGLKPQEEDLAKATAAIDYRYVLLDQSALTVRYRHPGVHVDLGGIAKGYSVDRAVAVLKDAGVSSARVSAGGDMYLLGGKGAKPWVVGIRDPRSENAQEYVVRLPLRDVSVSTSGDYERFFIDEGERVHHILSPQSGKPVKGLQSVTVLGPDSTTTDALSTAVFVLGREKGLQLINRLPGIEAVMIDENRKMHYSDGLMAPAESPTPVERRETGLE